MMKDYNLKTALLAAVEKTGETIEAIVVGPDDEHDWDQTRSNQDRENRVLSVEEGLALLDKDYNNGYGGADCRPFYAWTQSRVYLVHEYDGATGLGWVPRHPVDCNPLFC